MRNRFAALCALALAALALNLAAVANVSPVPFLWVIYASAVSGLYFMVDPAVILVATIALRRGNLFRVAVYGLFLLPAFLFAAGGQGLLDPMAVRPAISILYAAYFALVVFGGAIALQKPEVGATVLLSQRSAGLKKPSSKNGERFD